MEAIEALVPALRRYARGLLGAAQDADDLVHDALVDALANLKPSLQPDALRPWLFTIMRNRFVSDRRKARHRATVTLDDDTVAIAATRPNQEASLQMRDLTLGLTTLSVEQREVLLLVNLEGFGYAQVATMLDIPLGTVMSRLSRARDRLADYMDGKARPALRSVQ